MSVTETSKKGSSLSPIIKFDEALKLAEVWVNRMSEVEDDEPTDAGKEGRPPRLGLGANVVRQCKVRPSDDPVERKLYPSWRIEKERLLNWKRNLISSKRHGVEDDEGNVDEGSRSGSFMKKATPRGHVLCPQP